MKRRLLSEDLIFLIIMGTMILFLLSIAKFVVKDTEDMNESRALKQKIQPCIEEYNSTIDNLNFCRLDVYKDDKVFQVVQYIYAPSYVIDTYDTLISFEEDKEASKQWDIYIGDLKQYSENAKEYIKANKHCIMSAKYINIDNMEELIWVDEYGVIKYNILNVENLGELDYVD